MKILFLPLRMTLPRHWKVLDHHPSLSNLHWLRISMGLALTFGQHVTCLFQPLFLSVLNTAECAKNSVGADLMHIYFFLSWLLPVLARPHKLLSFCPNLPKGAMSLVHYTAYQLILDFSSRILNWSLKFFNIIKIVMSLVKKKTCFYHMMTK